MLDEIELLRRYAQHQDENAFAELVGRHVDMVYSAALRQMAGDAHLARDAAQSVFADLARKAPSLVRGLERGKPLVGWLYTSVRFAAGNLRRAEQRRAARERTAHAMNEALQSASDDADLAWSELRPLLDEAMGRLRETDRDAVLLRYFSGKNLRETGAALGLSEEAARKRVDRALGQLRGLLSAKGIRTSAAALSGILSAHGAPVAPAGLAASLAKGSLAAGAAGATAGVSTFAFLSFMTANVKITIAAIGILLAGAALYRAQIFSKPRELGEAPRPASAVGGIPPSREAARRSLAAREGDLEDPKVLAAIARIRAALIAPGRTQRYPQPEMEAAIADLGEHGPAAVPILREGLQSPDWEVRRRAASALRLLGGAGAEAVPELMAMLREAPLALDAALAAGALEIIGVDPSSIPELIVIMRENSEARGMIANMLPSLVKEGSDEAARVAELLRPLLDDPDPELQAEAGRAASGILKTSGSEALLTKAISNLGTGSENIRLSALTTIDHAGLAATNAIPALKSFLTQRNREDLKEYAERLLLKIDPGAREERQSAEYKSLQEERARAFAEKARAGQASVSELVAALREFPQAIPDAARALGAIGHQEMGRRSRESPEAMEDLMSATIMLTKIAGGNEPLETRLAASEAYRQLQPMREKLLYTKEEAAPAFAAVENSLRGLAGENKERVQRSLNGLLEIQRHLWTTIYKRPGEVTDYRGTDLEGFARNLARDDRGVHDAFVAAMRKADAKFLQRP